MVGVLVAAILGFITFAWHAAKSQRASSPQAEYARLADLKTGVTLNRFRAALDGAEPDRRAAVENEPGRHRYLFARPYEIVLAVTDSDETVLSFAVMARRQHFHPTFKIPGERAVVLGETYPAQAWSRPGAIGSNCGNPIEYFEISGSQSNARPIARAVGMRDTGKTPDQQLNLVCAIENKAAECRALLSGDARLQHRAVPCLLSDPRVDRLRRRLPVNVYAQGDAFLPLSYDLITPFAYEIDALTSG
jgi:hypothetical protein